MRLGTSVLGTSVLGTSVLGIPLLAGTPPEKKLKIVVTGGHPDDPETGCGGLIALLTKGGHKVSIGYLTRGEAGIAGTSHQDAAALRTKEAQAACKLLNATPHFLGQIDGDSGIDRQEYEKMHRFLTKEKPDLLLTHWPIDTHRDHRVCSALTYDAWLRLERKPDLYFYEVLTGSQTQNFAPTDYVDISEVLTLKHQACFIHESQHVKEDYPNSHEKMEIFRGMESGYQFAEAFVKHAHNRQQIVRNSL